MLEKSQHLIELTTANVLTEVAKGFVDLQVMLTLWRQGWPEAQHSPLQRSLLAVQGSDGPIKVMCHVAEDVR